MIWKKAACALSLLLLFSLVSGAAGAEEPVPATPTDLECLHEQTRTIIYFFDSPAYTPAGADAHLVSGPAAVETVCAECGEVLSSETVANAEQIRPHSMKKGVCALCGYRDKTEETQQEKPANTSGERVIIAREGGSTEGLYTLTLTTEDLYQLASESVTTILVQGKNGGAAVALNVAEVLGQTEATGADLYLEIAEREDGSFFAGLFLTSDSGVRSQPGNAGITLRFYRQTKSNVRISLAPVGSDSLIEAESVWNEKGYWSVPYLQEGTYFLLQ